MGLGWLGSVAQIGRIRPPVTSAAHPRAYHDSCPGTLYRYTLLLYGTAEDMTARPTGSQVTSSVCVKWDTEGLWLGECPVWHGPLAGSVSVQSRVGRWAGATGFGLTSVSMSPLQNATAPPPSWATSTSPTAHHSTSVTPTRQ